MIDAVPQFDLDWAPGRRRLAWRFGDHHVVKEFIEPPASVCCWPDPPSVLLVEAVSKARLDNAVVLEPTGAERLRLHPPQVVAEPSWAIGFYAVYESMGQLVAVFSTTVGDFWGRPDLRTGRLSGVSTWR